MLSLYLSDQHLSDFGDSAIEYDRRSVLQPDVITEGLAYVASTFANGEVELGTPISVAEIGTGAAPFLSWMAERVSSTVALSLTGVDIDPQTLPYARYNVGRQLARRNNDQDSLNLSVGNWGDLLLGAAFDCMYFNPPYLPEGEVVREEYRDTPVHSMYVMGSTDGLDHYRNLLAPLKAAMSFRGRLIIRTPRNRCSAEQVGDMVASVFGTTALHSVEVESEMGDRVGGGLIVDKNGGDSIHFKLGLIRAIGLGITYQESVA